MKEMQEAWVQSLVCKYLLEKKMATHSNILACRISWTEEPGGLQSLRSQRVVMIEQLTLSYTHIQIYICVIYIICYVKRFIIRCNGSHDYGVREVQIQGSWWSSSSQVRRQKKASNTAQGGSGRTSILMHPEITFKSFSGHLDSVKLNHKFSHHKPGLQNYLDNTMLSDKQLKEWCYSVF